MSFVGFENPCHPYQEPPLRLNDLIMHPGAAFLHACTSDTPGLAIRKGDWILCDKTIRPNGDSWVLIELFGDIGIIKLNQPIHTLDEQLMILGTIVIVIHHHYGDIPHLEEPTPDLDSLLFPNPLTGFISRASGHTLKGAAVLDGSLLVVRREVDYTSGSIAVLHHNNRFISRILNFVDMTLDDSYGGQMAMPKPLSCEGIITASIDFIVEHPLWN